jgi:hypothetical protein
MGLPASVSTSAGPAVHPDNTSTEDEMSASEATNARFRACNIVNGILIMH